MITRIHTLSYESMRARAADLEKDESAAIVSILDPGPSATLCGSTRRLFPEDTDRIVTVAFDDVQTLFFAKTKRMNSTQGAAIFKVIDFAHRSAEQMTLWINCALGVSRSGGVALFAREYCDVPHEVFDADIPPARQKSANEFVYRAMWQIARRALAVR